MKRRLCVVRDRGRRDERRKPPMQLGALGWKEVVVQRLPHELVAERSSGRQGPRAETPRRRTREAPPSTAPKASSDSCARSACVGRRPMRDAMRSNAWAASDRPAALATTMVRTGVGTAPSSVVGEQLLDVERVAVRALEQRLDGGASGVASRILSARTATSSGVRGESVIRSVSGSRSSSPSSGTSGCRRWRSSLRYESTSRIRSVRRFRRQEADELARRSIGPVEIFEQDHEGPIRAEPAHEREQLLEQVAFVRAPRTCGWFGSGELGIRRAIARHEWPAASTRPPTPISSISAPKRLHDRREHDPVATELDAAAAQRRAHRPRLRPARRLQRDGTCRSRRRPRSSRCPTRLGRRGGMTGAGRRARPPCRPAPGSSAASTWRDHRPRPGRAQCALPSCPGTVEPTLGRQRVLPARSAAESGTASDVPDDRCGRAAVPRCAAAGSASTVGACAQSRQAIGAHRAERHGPPRRVTSPRRAIPVAGRRDGRAAAAIATRRAAGSSGCQARMSDAPRASDSAAKPPQTGSCGRA